MSSKTIAPDHGAPLSVQIEAGDAICKRFMGFGAEWDSSGYPAAGITADDFTVIQNRVRRLRLPVARIMMQAKWCYQGAGRFDWDSDAMKALCRHLDVCQSLGTVVLLAEWGCEPQWLQCPDVARFDDPKYAEIIGTYLDYLLNQRAYTCIRYFIMGNEPNYEVKDWERWKAGVTNVFAEVQRRGLGRHIAFAGADHSNAPDWHKRAVEQLQQMLGAYDVHRYAGEDELRNGGLGAYLDESWQYALRKDPAAQGKPLIVGEAGLWVGGTGSADNPLHMSYGYGVKMGDYAVQAANAGSWAVLAWMLDDNSHVGFTWGMWTSKTDGLQCKPWFYVWALLCKCFPAGSTIVRTNHASSDIRILAAYREQTGAAPKRQWSVCLVNRADTALEVRVRMAAGPRCNMSRYVYSMTSAKTDQDGFPAPLDRQMQDMNAGADIHCEANSVVILSSMDDSDMKG